MGDIDDSEPILILVPGCAMCQVVAGRASQPEKQAASTSEVGRFETEILSTPSNLTTLINLSDTWIDKVHQRKPLKELILDLDSSVRESYGQQEGSAYNGLVPALDVVSRIGAELETGRPRRPLKKRKPLSRQHGSGGRAYRDRAKDRADSRHLAGSSTAAIRMD